MKTAIALIATALTVSSAHAWGDREQGILAGVVGTLVLQHIHRDHQQRQSQPQVVVQDQPVVVYRQPQPVIIQSSPQIMCPQGTAAFYIQRYDRYGRPFYEFDGCK